MRNLVLAFMFAFLGGCAAVETTVSTFHELDQPLSGVTYVLIPTKEQEGSLEFQSYAKLIKAELEKRGMIEAEVNQAKYAVFMFYGIDDGKQVVSSRPIFGQTGSGSSYTSGTVTTYGNTASYNSTTYKTPTYGVVGTRTKTETIFKRFLNIDIIDVAKSGDGKVQKVYEGKAVSLGESGHLPPVMPAIVRSVFEEFPGKSGSTRTSRQPLEK